MDFKRNIEKLHGCVFTTTPSQTVSCNVWKCLKQLEMFLLYVMWSFNMHNRPSHLCLLRFKIYGWITHDCGVIFLFAYNGVSVVGSRKIRLCLFFYLLFAFQLIFGGGTYVVALYQVEMCCAVVVVRIEILRSEIVC